MMKKVIVSDGEIINVGEWDYQYVEIDGEQIAMNPLPDGATEEEREMGFSEERGWFEVGTSQKLPETEQRLADLELIMTELLMGGLI